MSISKFDDIIDSREVIERIAELEDIEGIEDQIAALEESDDATELVALRELAAEAEGYASDWRHGAQLIHDSYFEDYARELAGDIGAISRDAKWPLQHIDWAAAAAELQQDYTAVDFDGETYWVQ